MQENLFYVCFTMEGRESLAPFLSSILGDLRFAFAACFFLSFLTTLVWRVEKATLTAGVVATRVPDVKAFQNEV